MGETNETSLFHLKLYVYCDDIPRLIRHPPTIFEKKIFRHNILMKKTSRDNTESNDNMNIPVHI